MIRNITLVALIFFTGNANASPEVMEKLSNESLEKIVESLGAAISKPSFGKCQRILLRAKSVNRKEGQHIAQDVNDLLSRVSPEEMSYSFGLLVRKEGVDNGLVDSLSSLAEPALRQEERVLMEAPAADLQRFLNENQSQYLAGTASFLNVSDDKTRVSKAEYSVRAVIDFAREEFFLLGTGVCDGQ